jgi:hypothetical protein
MMADEMLIAKGDAARCVSFGYYGHLSLGRLSNISLLTTHATTAGGRLKKEISKILNNV